MGLDMVSLPSFYIKDNSNGDTEIPQYVPGAAYRQLEFLLGRIKNLQERGPYTTQRGRGN